MEDDKMFVAEQRNVGFFLVTSSGKVAIPTNTDVVNLLQVLQQKTPVMLSGGMLAAIPQLK
jgi:hypothetical protein